MRGFESRPMRSTRCCRSRNVLAVAGLRYPLARLCHSCCHEQDLCSPAPTLSEALMGWPSSTPIADEVVNLGDGRVVSYASWGQPDGRPVVFVNGCPGSRLMCPDVEETVAAGVRLFTIDRPGYGRSSPLPGRRVVDWVADFVEWADLIGLPRVLWSGGQSVGSSLWPLLRIAPLGSRRRGLRPAMLLWTICTMGGARCRLRQGSTSSRCAEIRSRASRRLGSDAVGSRIGSRSSSRTGRPTASSPSLSTPTTGSRARRNPATTA